VFVLRAFFSDEQWRLKFLLGARVPFPQELVDLDRERCALAEWTLDKVAKNFLVQAWRARETMMGGGLRIMSGRVVVVPPARRIAGPVSSQPKDYLANVPPRVFWEPWIQRESLWNDSLCNSGPSPFYVVFKGRTLGLFYKWYRVRRSVVGFDGAYYRGFDTLYEASVAYGRFVYAN
jgi:hypothetical protein